MMNTATNIDDDLADPQAVYSQGYSPLKRLGKGSQGSVYKWVHDKTGEIVAIKSKSKAGNSNCSSDLSWEAHIMQYLDHCFKDDGDTCVGVVPFKGFIQSGNKASRDAGQHLVLGFCDGGSLQDHLFGPKQRTMRTLSELNAAKLLKSLAKTLLKCHAVGIVHRDIKMENIFLRSKSSPHASSSSSSRKRAIRDGDEALGHSEMDDYDVFLGDFGLATFIYDPRLKEEVAGTSIYMAPELIAAIMYSSDDDAKNCELMKDFDQRMDIWSLGVLIHLLLTGEPPFHLKFYSESEGFARDSAAAKEALFHDILTIPLNFQDAARYSHLSFNARDLLSKMLQKDPNTRISLLQIIEHPWLSAHATSKDGNNFTACKRQKHQSDYTPCKNIINLCSSDYTPMSNQRHVAEGNVPSPANAAQGKAAYNIPSSNDYTPLSIPYYKMVHNSYKSKEYTPKSSNYYATLFDDYTPLSMATILAQGRAAYVNCY